MMGPDCGTAIRRFTFESSARWPVNGCPPVAMAPKVSAPASASLSYFIQPDTEEEVVFLLISFHSRNAFPASGKRVAGRITVTMIVLVPAARINQCAGAISTRERSLNRGNSVSPVSWSKVPGKLVPPSLDSPRDVI